VTGTEVLSGRVTDRNGPWVSERLGELGVEVAQIICVADRPDDLRSALEFCRDAGVDLIVTTGGLGPTADDLTAEVVAAFAERPMELDEGMEKRIAAIIEGFAKRYKFDPEGLAAGTRKQAMVPVGATALDPAGTAPGLVVPAGSATVIVLPGPPRELQTIWPAAIAVEDIQTVLAGAESYETATMKMFGIPESTLAKSLREIEAEADLEALEITTCLRRGSELEIDVRYRAADAAANESLFAGLRARHGAFIYTETGEALDELLAALLRGRTIAAAESCTAGMFASRLADTPGSSEYLRGGVVAYSDQAKTDLLGIDAELIAAHGAVSAEVAAAMAAGARERFGAEIGIGITGVAGPGGGSEEKPVGFVCVCVADDAGNELARQVVMPGSRNDIRERTVGAGMHMLRRLLLGQNLPI